MSKDKNGSASARKSKSAESFDGLDLVLEQGAMPTASDFSLPVEAPTVEGQTAKPRPRGARTPRASTAAKTRAPKRGRLVAVQTEAQAPIPAAVPIHQIYFRDDQRQSLDPDLLPHNNSGQAGALLEFEVFERLMGAGGMGSVQRWGAVSWKFFAKTGLSGADLAGLIQADPECDLYFCNPSPDNESIYINLWQQGLVVHPGFRELCQAVLEAAGMESKQLDAIMPSQAFSTCNYFVGSHAFWSSYLPFVRELIDRARATLPTAVLRVLDSSAGDPRNMHAGSSYWPFIVERLLPAYLRGPGASLKVRKLALPEPESRLNSHLRRLREMKDVAHNTRSQWLYSCWLHYRNMYLLQANGRDWCLRYLPQLTPAEIVFW
jgi:hypothetical protein